MRHDEVRLFLDFMAEEGYAMRDREMAQKVKRGESIRLDVDRWREVAEWRKKKKEGRC